MAQYYVHLGYDWNRYKIGSVWGTSTSNDFDLQCALTTNKEPTSTKPPWQGALFSFKSGDSLYFQIWDLTKKPRYAVPGSVKASIGLNSVDGKTIFHKDSKVVELGTGLSWSTFDDNGKSAPNPCIGFAPELDHSHRRQSPWGSAFPRSSWVGPLTLLDPEPHSIPIDIEMNFFMEVTVGRECRVFVEDPETVIGSGSQVGDC
jgi:hypothetical protein